MAIAFKNKVQNTGAVTINVNGLGAKSIVKSNGNTLASGNLRANSVYTIRYNGTNFILQGEGGEYGNATAADVLIGKTIGTENGIVTGTLQPMLYAKGNSGFDSTNTTVTLDNGVSVSGYRLVKFSGLAFKPSLIIVNTESAGKNYTTYYKEEGVYGATNPNTKIIGTGLNSNTFKIQLIDSLYVDSTSFALPVPTTSVDYVEWYAIK